MQQGNPQALNGQFQVYDLDAELEAIDLSPRPVKVGGVTYQVRRDLTGEEVAEFWRYLRTGENDAEALAILVGDDAVSLYAAMRAMPQARMNRTTVVLLETAGLQAAVAGQGGDQGGPSAS